MIDDASEPGAWRSALNPNATCKLCKQAVCGHSDLQYAGLVPASDGGARRDLPGGSAPAVPFHPAGVAHA